MEQHCVRHAPIDIRHRREGRVHHDDARRDRGIQMIVDLRRVEAGYDDAWEKMVKQRRACLGQLVQGERTTGDLGEDGEQPGAGRGFQHVIGRRDGGCVAAGDRNQTRECELGPLARVVHIA